MQTTLVFHAENDFYMPPIGCFKLSLDISHNAHPITLLENTCMQKPSPC
jgi:hypothetical protein